MNALTGKFIMLYANGYNMQNENGTTNEGISVRYLLTESLSPVTGTDGSRGVGVAKVALPVEQGKNIKSVPGMYEGQFAMKAKSDGKVDFKLESVKFISDIEMNVLSPAQSK